jgi:hypothetical protein
MEMASSTNSDCGTECLIQQGTAESYPEAIFGKLPEGFVFENQNVETLVHWFNKAMKAALGFAESTLAASSNIVMFDDAVDERCRAASRSRSPFFDETRLPARAKLVLRSLKIDTEFDDRVIRETH